MSWVISPKFRKMMHTIADRQNNKKDDYLTDIPRDPQKFYDSFGHFQHFKRDRNNMPLSVKKLAPYQIAHWAADTDVLHVKSNKIGLSSSALLEDFQRAILPENRGGEVIIGAQDQNFANQHVMDLKLMIKFSKNYSNYLIERPDQKYLREMQSKVSAAYIANPDGGRPSVIVGVGQNPSRVFSWKRVVHIHLSDIALIPRKDWSEYWRGLYSRRAQTGGLIKIESVPKGQQGLVWYLYNVIHSRLANRQKKKRRLATAANTPAKSRHEEEEPEDLQTMTMAQEAIDAQTASMQLTDEDMPTSFRYLETDYRPAIRCGAMPKKTIDDAKRILSKMEFASTFCCKFNPPGNQWYESGWFTRQGGYGMT